MTPIKIKNKIKKAFFWLAIIFLLSLICRMIYLHDYMRTDIFPLFPDSDSHGYFLWARDIAAGDVLGDRVFTKWPLYAYLLGLFFALAGQRIILVYLMQMILGSAGGVLLYFIAREIFDDSSALVSALIYSLYSLFIFHEGLLVYTGLFVFLNILAVFWMLRLQEKADKKRLFCLGLFFGLCTLLQANALFFGLAACVWIIWLIKDTRQKSLFLGMSFALGLFLIISLAAVRNYIVENDLIPISGNTGINFYIGNSSEANGLYRTPEGLSPFQEGMLRDARVVASNALGQQLKASEISRYWYNRTLEDIKGDPFRAVKLLLVKTAFFFGPMEFVHDPEFLLLKDEIRLFRFLPGDLRYFFPLTILGMIAHRKKHKRHALLYIAMVSYGLSTVMYFVSARYRMPVIPWLIVFSGAGLVTFWKELRKGEYLRTALMAVFLLTVFSVTNQKAYESIMLKRLTPGEVQQRLLLDRALAHERDDHYDKALAELYAADQLIPNNQYVKFAAGVIHYHRREMATAEEKFLEALTISPLYVNAYYNLGILYEEQGRFIEAREALETAVHLDPEDVGAHFTLARVYRSLGEVDQAIKEFERALSKSRRGAVMERRLILMELATTKGLKSNG